MTVKKLLIYTLLFIVSFCQQADAQNKKDIYKQTIRLIEKNIQQYFYDSASGNYKEFNERSVKEENEFCYLWPLCGLVQAANEAEVIHAAPEGYLKNILKTIYNYEDTSAPAPAYASYLNTKKAARFYDDNQWIAIACLDAYARTKDTAYLLEGHKIYTFMMTGYDSLAGGGLYWKEGDHSTKNTCSNGPAIIVALQLYQVTKQQHYLDTALMLYNWVNKNLAAPEHIYYDNIQLPSMKIDKRFYTYNAATMLQSSVLLYEITGQQKYLSAAKEIAESAYNYFYKDKHWPEGYWFNAVLLRAYLQLYKYDTTKKYIAAFISDADLIWLHQKDDKSLIGKKQRKQLIDQAAMLEIYCRLLPFVK